MQTLHSTCHLLLSCRLFQVALSPENMATEKSKQIPQVDSDLESSSPREAQKKSGRGPSESVSGEKTRRKGTISPVMISSASPSLSQGSGQTKPLPTHAGIQYDSYEKSFAARTLAKDPLPSLVTWPQDSVLVEEQKRKLRTSKPALPVRTPLLASVCLSVFSCQNLLCVPSSPFQSAQVARAICFSFDC